MSEHSPVTYTVTEQHMCQLATLAHTGRLQTCHGRALFLMAIAAHVWPFLQIRMVLQPTPPHAQEAIAVLEVVESAKQDVLEVIFDTKQPVQQALELRSLLKSGRFDSVQIHHDARDFIAVLTVYTSPQVGLGSELLTRITLIDDQFQTQKSLSQLGGEPQ